MGEVPDETHISWLPSSRLWFQMWEMLSSMKKTQEWSEVDTTSCLELWEEAYVQAPFLPQTLPRLPPWEISMGVRMRPKDPLVRLHKGCFPLSQIPSWEGSMKCEKHFWLEVGFSIGALPTRLFYILKKSFKPRKTEAHFSSKFREIFVSTNQRVFTRYFWMPSIPEIPFLYLEHLPHFEYSLI